MHNVIIRSLLPGDVHELQRLSRQTFIEAFSWGNAENNLLEYVDKAFSLEKLSTEIADPNCRFYFATIDDNCVGYLKLNFNQAQTEFQDANCLEIERIYVLAAFLKKGIGQALMQEAINIARSNKLKWIWLGVWEKNEPAIGFYQKNGFTIIGKHNFKLGEEIQTDIIMRLDM